jgi:2',3'-cyclic-nucleotide 2'-phosphodiesterase (5'-nucleotidase family)
LAQTEGAHIAKAFRAIHYDALNIADGEIMAGDTFFDSFLSDPVFPLISTNIHLTENNNESVKPYIIKKIGEFRFGIIGILSDHFFKEPFPDSITINDPVASIKKYLPELQEKSDFIILMSHSGMIKTKELLKDLPDIDIAIIGHDLYPDFEPELFENKWILKNSDNGGTVGVVKIWIDQSGRINNIKTNLELIDMKVKITPEYSMIETDFNSEIRKMGNPDNRLKLEIEKAKKYLELSPEEFFKQRENKSQTKPISNIQN